MTDSKYLEECRRTLSTQEDVLGHMVVGLSTEAGELLDAYKKHRFYGRELDVRNVREEISDVMYYLVQLADEVGYSLDQAKVDNIEKLKRRYPEGFEDKIIRDSEYELKHIEVT